MPRDVQKRVTYARDLANLQRLAAAIPLDEQISGADKKAIVKSLHGLIERLMRINLSRVTQAADGSEAQESDEA